MKPAAEWEEQDLQSLIDAQTPEGLNLEYKRAAALSEDGRDDLSKFVSAFANSAGGVLIYGIEEDRATHKPVRIDAVTESRYDREWIDQVMGSNIQPRLQGVIIRPIHIASGGTAFAIDVPPATTSGPHQAADKRYYKRRNFHLDRMEDYEIRDVMRRATTPHLRPSLQVGDQRGNRIDGTLFVELKIMVRNLTNQPALYSILRALVDKRVSANAEADWRQKSEARMVFRTSLLPMVVYEQARAVPAEMPIFREELTYPGGLLIAIPAHLKHSEPPVIAISAITPGHSETRYWELMPRGLDKVDLVEASFNAPSVEVID